MRLVIPWFPLNHIVGEMYAPLLLINKRVPWEWADLAQYPCGRSYFRRNQRKQITDTHIESDIHRNVIEYISDAACAMKINYCIFLFLFDINEFIKKTCLPISRLYYLQLKLTISKSAICWSVQKLGDLVARQGQASNSLTRCLVIQSKAAMLTWRNGYLLRFIIEWV